LPPGKQIPLIPQRSRQLGCFAVALRVGGKRRLASNSVNDLPSAISASSVSVTVVGMLIILPGGHFPPPTFPWEWKVGEKSAWRAKKGFVVGMNRTGGTVGSLYVGLARPKNRRGRVGPLRGVGGGSGVFGRIIPVVA
jgi:hypothetical protein